MKTALPPSPPPPPLPLRKGGWTPERRDETSLRLASSLCLVRQSVLAALLSGCDEATSNSAEVQMRTEGERECV